MPASRRRALLALSRAMDDGDLVIDPGSDPAEVRDVLSSLPGVGSWTARYVTMRALRDPDIFLATDLGVRRAGEALDPSIRVATLEGHSQAWRPWRSYATMHLWHSLHGTFEKTGTR